jgi:hypothetical protein
MFLLDVLQKQRGYKQPGQASYITSPSKKKPSFTILVIKKQRGRLKKNETGKNKNGAAKNMTRQEILGVQKQRIRRKQTAGSRTETGSVGNKTQ